MSSICSALSRRNARSIPPCTMPKRTGIRGSGFGFRGEASCDRLTLEVKPAFSESRIPNPGSFVIVLGSPCPAPRELRGAARGLMTRRVCDAFVQGHNDVGAQRQLDLDGALGREEVGGTVQVRPEVDAVLGDLTQTFQAHHLEASAVGEDRMRPGDEAVQAAGGPHGLVPGPQVKMIGVGQQDLDAQPLEILLGHAFDAARRADRHEGGSLDDSVGRMEEAGARAGARVARGDLELQSVWSSAKQSNVAKRKLGSHSTGCVPWASPVVTRTHGTNFVP